MLDLIYTSSTVVISYLDTVLEWLLIKTKNNCHTDFFLLPGWPRGRAWSGFEGLGCLTCVDLATVPPILSSQIEVCLIKILRKMIQTKCISH